MQAVCWPHAQSHASYGRCGLGSHGTDRIVALVREEAASAAARGETPALFGAKITGGGSGGACFGPKCFPKVEGIPVVSLRIRRLPIFVPSWLLVCNPPSLSATACMQ